ncbi:MAG: hypothetical protein K0R38_2695 [Polyangiaceae bacterium]|jgi:hypothetical protein|nr:hypothetical protein [Polyangiaceae bacterium]
MTRKQVAERLGKSVATVRRLEGVLLHPKLDSKGKHVFDADEVTALIEGIRAGEITLWQQMRATTESLEGIGVDNLHAAECSRCTELEDAIAQLRRQLVEQERGARRELDAVRAERDREQDAYRVEQRNFERELRRFVDEVVDS